jgi:imidazolonepropionase
VATRKVDLVIKNANELLTIAGGSQKPLLGKRMKELGIIADGGLAVDKGRIVAVGSTENIIKRFKGKESLEANEKVVMPGFVDPHTHLVFAGSRESEFEMRLRGASYMEILRKGGGILKTVQETRKASKIELLEKCKKTLKTMLEHGTTTVEAKSGYGLNVKDEIKCLEVMKILNNKQPVEVVSTFLGAHAIPLECETDVDEYVALIIKEMIPTVANRKLAEFCDVFCEKGVFSIEQSRKILLNGKKHGLMPKLHADEITNLGGTELAAEIAAVSAEHLLFASDRGIKMLAEKGVIAVLLPGAAFSLMLGRYAEARKMIELNVPVALGTDFNPSCWIENMQTIMTLACYQMKMAPAEAIVASTINAAHAINRAKEVGSLEVGKKADILVLEIPSYKFLGYRHGVNLIDKVLKNGTIVVEYSEHDSWHSENLKSN